MTVSAIAKVTVTMEIEVSSSWGKDCPLDQIYKQATEEAIGKINKAFPIHSGTLILNVIPTAIIVPRKS